MDQYRSREVAMKLRTNGKVGYSYLVSHGMFNHSLTTIGVSSHGMSSHGSTTRRVFAYGDILGPRGDGDLDPSDGVWVLIKSGGDSRSSLL